MRNVVLLAWGSLSLTSMTITQYTGSSGNNHKQNEPHQTLYLYGSLTDLIFSLAGISCDGYDTIDISLVAVVACGCVTIPVFVTGVALLGLSSFEFDTIQGNGQCVFSHSLQQFMHDA